ncbi:hypothetical protein [Halorussus salinus]|uniref:hypothetical protein n=1 Tax=Halorussus salinus TaxID=1364935 RepID=UPI00138F6EB2|nr:hypothetical protein [Halorussus salinus]
MDEDAAGEAGEKSESGTDEENGERPELSDLDPNAEEQARKVERQLRRLRLQR